MLRFAAPARSFSVRGRQLQLPVRRASSRPPPHRQQPAGRGGADDQAAGADFLKRPPVVRLAPEAQQKLFLLPEGYKIEPVLTDPLIQDPVGVTFDGNGRMYVLEMRSYMQDAAGTNSRAPISRISRHEDTDGDGVYDKHTIFVDNMVMPRIAFPLGDGVILALETDNRDLYKYTDTNGDGVADKKELFYQGVGRVQNMEWQPGGMTWALDNWIYTTYNPFRLRITPARQDSARRDRTERRPVVVRAGQLRQDLVGGRRRRAWSGQHPGSDRLRRVQRAG